jgi:hypothetical protein
MTDGYADGLGQLRQTPQRMSSMTRKNHIVMAVGEDDQHALSPGEVAVAELRRETLRHQLAALAANNVALDDGLHAALATTERKAEPQPPETERRRSQGAANLPVPAQTESAAAVGSGVWFGHSVLMLLSRTILDPPQGWVVGAGQKETLRNIECQCGRQHHRARIDARLTANLQLHTRAIVVSSNNVR